jgi:hypothetical protein
VKLTNILYKLYKTIYYYRNAGVVAGVGVFIKYQANLIIKRG